MGRYLSSEIFDERFWHWRKRGVAVGAGWGGASAILPAPMQSFWGMAACIWKKGNIPVAVFMAWLSPPGSFIVVVPLQWWLGWWILTALGFTGSGANIGMMKSVALTRTLEPLGDLNYWMMGTEFILGVILSCTALGFLCYGLVYGVWSLVDWLKKGSDEVGSGDGEGKKI